MSAGWRCPYQSCRCVGAFLAATALCLAAAATASARTGPAASPEGRANVDGGQGAGEQTILVLDSQPGDAFGPAWQKTYTTADSSLTIARLEDNAVHLAVDRLDASSFWRLDFYASGEPIVPGSYGASARYPVAPLNGLDVEGDGRTCFFVTGRFVVREAVYGSGGEVLRFAADFERHCDGAPGVLYGAIRYRSTVGSALPFDGNYPAHRLTLATPVNGRITGPGLDCGGGAVACVAGLGVPGSLALTATADAGYLFAGWAGDCSGASETTVLVDGVRSCGAHFAAQGAAATILAWNSDQYDSLGHGRPAVFSPDTSRWTATADPQQRFVQVKVDTPSETWTVTIGAADRAPLVPGSYIIGPDIPGFAYFNISSSLWGCGGSGRVNLLDIDVGTDGTLHRLAADFDYHCFSFASGLHGSIRYNSSRPLDLLALAHGSLREVTIMPPDHGRVRGAGLDCGLGGTSCQLHESNQIPLTLTAEPEAGYLFAGWSGECSGGPSLAFTLLRPITCGAIFEPAAGVTSRTLMRWDSDDGSGAAPVTSQVFSVANSAWMVTADDGGRDLQVALRTLFGDWNVGFSGPEPLAPGAYRVVRGGPPGAGNILQVDGCYELTGRFTIRELVYAPDGSVSRFAADVEFHCGDEAVGNFGAIRYQSSVLDTRPFAGAYPFYRLTMAQPSHGRVTAPGIACGGGASSCAVVPSSPTRLALRAVADPGYFFAGWTGDCSGPESTSIHVNGDRACGASFLPLDASTPRTILLTSSEPGEHVGQGQREVLSGANSIWRVERLDPPDDDGASLDVTILGIAEKEASAWTIRVGFPGGAAPQPGDQVNTTGVVLAVLHNGRSCGPVRIETPMEIAIGPGGEVQRLALAFEQRCYIDQPALRLVVRYNSAAAPAILTVDEPRLWFVAVTGPSGVLVQPAPQFLRLSRLGPAVADWVAHVDSPWLMVSPAAGSGPATLSLTATWLPGEPLIGDSVGTLTFTAPGSAIEFARLEVRLSAVASGTTGPPFGTLDTPTPSAGVLSGAVPFTGWALDDVGVAEVTICRDSVPPEVAPLDSNCGGTAQIYVGRGTFIEGARPDVAAAYRFHPRRGVAGWGLMVLTNMLPGQGNGVHRFAAYARDMENHVTLLGTRSVTISNRDAVAPFGTIDTPEQGETISGAEYVSFGWALTPQPKVIAQDGTTLMAYIDGEPIGHPSYNHYRSDIAEAFPGLANSLGAVGYNLLDTTTLDDGLHTIVWAATDSEGVTQGLGSRFFRVFNAGDSVALTRRGEMEMRTAGAGMPTAVDAVAAPMPDDLPMERRLVRWRRGWDPGGAWQQTTRATATVRGEELDRFEILLETAAGGSYTGYLRFDDALRTLPMGSRLDPVAGRFTWAPPAGFVGSYDLVFVRMVQGQPIGRRDVRVVVVPKGSSRGPQVVIDTPRQQQEVPQPFPLGGWAVDLDAAEGAGIATLHVWAYPLTGGAPIFLGTAEYGGGRPDVAAIHGDQFEASGFGLSVQGLEPGNYDLAVFAWSEVTGGFVPATVVRVTVR